MNATDCGHIDALYWVMQDCNVESNIPIWNLFEGCCVLE